MSLNRAGDDHGDSIFCLPWMDDENKAIHFEVHQPDFRYLTISRDKIKQAREQYSFLQDRHESYEELELSRR